MKIPATMHLTGPASFAKPEAEKKTRRCAQHAHAGSRITGFFADLIYDLKGMETPRQFPLLQQHDPTKIVALATESSMLEDGLHLLGDMYDTLAAREVANLADQGFPWQASIGVRTLEAIWVDEGKELEVNGRLEKGPFVCVTKSRVFESSFVPLGADGNTSSVVLSDNGGTDVVVIKDAPGGAKDETMSGNSVPAPAADPNALVLQERKRVSDIRLAFPKDPGFALKHIELGSSVLEARAAYADELSKKVEELERKGPPLPALPNRGSGEAPAASAMERWNEALAAMLPANASAKQRGDAIERLAIRDPQLHAAYLEEFNLTVKPRARG